jgi:pyrroloquinoline quinone (PQQ) biosynthesis protein C
MSSAMMSAIKCVIDKNIDETVQALSVKYGFSLADAMEFLQSKKSALVEEPVKKTKKVKKAVDPDKPKRAATGYLTYSKEMREQVKASLTAKLEDADKLKPQDVVKELGAGWKALSEDEQAVWNTKAKSTSSGSDDE